MIKEFFCGLVLFLAMLGTMIYAVDRLCDSQGDYVGSEPTVVKKGTK